MFIQSDVPWFNSALDLKLLGHKRTTSDEVAEAWHASDPDLTLDLEDTRR